MKTVSAQDIAHVIEQLEEKQAADLALWGRIVFALGRAQAASEAGKPLECQLLLSEAADLEYKLYLDCDSVGPLLDDEIDDQHLGGES